MKYLIKSALLLAIAIAFMNINCKKKEEAEPQANKGPDIKRDIVGRWKLTGFACDASGKCQRNYDNPQVRMIFTAEGEFYESQVSPLSYTIEGMNIIIRKPADKNNAGSGLYFKIVSLKDDQMLLLWNYNMKDSFHTRYQKVKEPDKKMDKEKGKK